MKYSEYVNLHSHTEYSNLRIKDSTNRLENMVLYVANELKQKGFALTDHEFIGHHVKALNTVKALKAKGKIPEDFKIILGNEIYLCDEEKLNAQLEAKNGVQFPHFILLAKDEIGHRQLQDISTRAWSHMFSYRGMDRVPTYYEDIEDVVDANPGHLIASTACLGGFLAKKILDGDYQSATNFIAWGQDVFGANNFFLEMQPHRKEYDENGLEITSEQEIVNRWICSQGFPTIITTDAHYLNEDARELHKAYLKSDEDDETYASGGRETDAFYSTTYFMSSDEIRSKITYLPDDFIDSCFANTIDIWSRCGEYDLAQATVIPEVPIPEEWYYDREVYQFVMEHDYVHIDEMLNSSCEYDEYLMKLAFDGIKERSIPVEEWDESLQRLDLEMYELLGISKIKNVSMSKYFVTMAKLIDIFWDEAECMTGCSRGSAAGWILNYLIGIVQENPLKQPVEMYHWRFISAERPEYPDIDTDLSSHKRDKAFNCVKEYLNTFNSDIVRIGTFKTDKPKSAIQTACRGYGLSPDIGLYLSSFIKVDRGQPRTIEQTYYGDEEQGYDASLEFKREIDKYPGLLETAIGIQGLVCGRGSHACGVAISNDMIHHTALMKAPNGEFITQYDLGDAEYCGLIKYDFLNTACMGMIQLTFENLINDGYIEWQGSLRKTYNKYLHPDAINYDKNDYYTKLNNHELIKVFQFETGTGLKALNAIKPTKLIELAAANTLMRLQCEGEQPMERYIRIRNNPEQWDEEMIKYGLNEEEREVLHKHLDIDYGTCMTQEMLMILSMDEKIAGFTVPEANKLRKAIAKKKKALQEAAKDLFYEKGLSRGTRKVMLDYVWDGQISMQLGYGFSILHTIGYSLIAIQQLELITSYPKIYWETSVLQVMSGAVDVEAVDEDSESRERITDYGKLGGAIATLQKDGVDIALPHINKAEKGFLADITTNSIIYGLKGISSINNKTAELIIANRPYTSMKDFHDRMHLVKQEVVMKDGKTQMKALITKEQMLNLIKAGCFDELEPDKTRLDLLEEYLHMEYPDKNGLTVGAINQLAKRGLIPDEYSEEMRYYNFRNYLREGLKVDDGVLPHTQESGYKVAKTKKWYLLDGEDELDTQEIIETFFDMFPELQEGKHWVYNTDDNYYSNAIWVESGSSSKGTFESVYKTHIKRLTQYLCSQDLLDAYNKALFVERKMEEIPGNQSSWEMETMCMYHSDHELAHLDRDYYKVDNYFELDEEPLVMDFWERKDKDTGEVARIPRFKINQICGTIIDRNKTKHILTLLTEYGVVYCKMVDGAFNHYDKRVSMMDEETGKKVTVEEGWFKRGTLLFVRGYRNGDQFKVKTYKNGLYEHSLELIEKVYDDGICLTKKERVKLD